MLLSVRANKESFKRVVFTPGFNVILAERTKESTIKDSRNGLGKSSLIQIIHFCLGGRCSKTLSSDKLTDWTFTLDFECSGQKYSVSRNTTNANKITVKGDCTNWPIKPGVDKDTGNKIMRVTDWRRLLGALMFDMQLEYAEQYAPTFRSCISYLARQNGESGGFLEPFTHYRNQQEWDKQVNNSFLLGLDWTYANKWQILKDRKKVLEQLKKETESGILQEMQGSIGQLEAKKVRLEEEIQKQEKELAAFKVHPQYARIERDANQLTSQIHSLINDITSNRKLLNHYEKSVEVEKEADIESVETIYKQAGVIMPDNIKKHLEDVKSFHNNVAKNRKQFLQSEIDRLKNAISHSDNKAKVLSDRRAELLSVLQTHGALKEYNKLQQRNAGMVSDLKNVTNQLENLKKFEQGKSSLKIDLELLQQQARLSMNEREKIKQKAISLFNSNSQFLYESPGTLSIDIKPTGFSFNVNIEREGSHGISNMKIFCYDLMLAQLWASQKVSPGFLVHDSILFADVDERQKALAIELAAKEAQKLGFQYICTMNSDNVPYNDFSEDFNFDQYIRVRLTDKTVNGALFGMRF